MNFLVDFGKEILRVLEIAFSELVTGLQGLLSILLLSEAVFSSLVLLFSEVKLLHPVFKDGVDVSNVEALGRQFLGIGRKLIFLSGDLRHQVLLLFLGLGFAVTVLAEQIGFVEDLSVDLLIVFFFTLKLGLLTLEFALPLVVELLQVTVLLSSLVNEGVTALDVLDGLLPLQVELVTLLMESAEFFSGFVKFNLSSLGLSDLILELLAFASDFNGELFNLKGELLNLGFIGASVLL